MHMNAVAKMKRIAAAEEQSVAWLLKPKTAKPQKCRNLGTVAVTGTTSQPHLIQ
jgi:hypothetical protein